MLILIIPLCLCLLGTSLINLLNLDLIALSGYKVQYLRGSKMRSEANEDEFYDGEDTARRAYVSQPDPEQNQPSQARKKYGNMLVLYRGRFVLTLGPDYWCFLPTFLVFCTLSILTLRFVLTSSANIYLHLATIIICFGTCLSYLLVAISNPGIITQQEESADLGGNYEGESNEKIGPQKDKKKRCRRCNLLVKRTTFHCSDCDVCISEYDHHCPWTSKCIGGGNLIRFYVFVGMVPIYIIYSFMVFGILMSQLAMEQASLQIQVCFALFAAPFHLIARSLILCLPFIQIMMNQNQNHVHNQTISHPVIDSCY